MANSTAPRDTIEKALLAFSETPLADAAIGLFSTLGYRSERHLALSLTQDFYGQFDPSKRLTATDRDALSQCESLNFLFQFTDAEFANQSGLFDEGAVVTTTKIESYLFFAVELPERDYSRGALAAIVRSINKPLPMPALVLLKHRDRISLGLIHRRLHRRDPNKDVLEKVTLVKDIAFSDPIRAHVEILNDFSFQKLDADFGVSNFVRLHEAWQKRLGSYVLSNAFYREIADWYFWAHHQVEDGDIRLPLHCDTERERSLFLIRLLTRVIFCWFLLEKRLIPNDTFRPHKLKDLLHNFKPSQDATRLDLSPTFYRAILQNLFFGTLNMPSDQRGFRKLKAEGQRYDPNYGITTLWRYEKTFHNASAWVKYADRIPFLNGGLFDCLDDKSGKKKDNFILDGFSDREDFGCHLPNDLFFGPERIVDLSRDYGEEGKPAARSRKAKVRGLIEILSRYKFTIEENTPFEEEIALDPELLGKVFENLLASYNDDTKTSARKALGAFYTPKEIVDYMVDEALKSHLSTQVPEAEPLLASLFSADVDSNEINLPTRDALVAAIGRVKILDPACGSGAFPMGALHRLVNLLQRLDPNNESWKRDRLDEARRYRELLEATNADKAEILACEERIVDIEKSFDTRFHALDFARKLYLIENCIYGVDIEPIATQIAKLRFFISLVVDQKVDEETSNLGVRPLPNLETRIVAADTLVPIAGEEPHLFSDELDQMRAELAAIRHEHFNARSPAKKRQCRERDEAQRHKIANYLEAHHYLPAESARTLATWDPYDQNTHAPFFDVGWMFGQTEVDAATGRFEDRFDIVIGNPPYIRIQTLKQKDPKLAAYYKDHYASASKGNYDIYVVFIEAGLKLLKGAGHLAYICPHKFLNSQYGEPLRKLVADGRHLRHIVHFGDQQVFSGATIYTCLLFLSRAGSDECRVVRVNDLAAWKATLSGLEGNVPACQVTSSEWNLAVGPGARVYERLASMPVKLGDVAEIFVGLQTSADTVFLFKDSQISPGNVTAVHSKESGTTVELESAILKPVVRSGELGRYWATPSALVLFPYEVTGHGFSLISETRMASHFPRAWAYLNSHHQLLAEREHSKFATSGWWQLYPKNLDSWEQTKILMPYMVTSLSAFYDTKGSFFVNVTTGGFGVTTHKSGFDMEWLTVLLNSQILDWFLKSVSTSFHGGYFAANKQFLVQLPIPSSEQAPPKSAVILCRWLQYAKDKLAEIGQVARDPVMLAYWERVLNGLVYEVYFADEVHGANLHLSALVEQARIPDIDIVADSDRLPNLRHLFEALYDRDHPVRIALDKLQTLDIVRIIEGSE